MYGENVKMEEGGENKEINWSCNAREMREEWMCPAQEAVQREFVMRVGCFDYGVLQ